jgi:hypothetical protein
MRHDCFMRANMSLPTARAGGGACDAEGRAGRAWWEGRGAAARRRGKDARRANGAAQPPL